MERTGTNIISQLQATVMATCWPVCILNQKKMGSKKTDWAFQRRKGHVQIQPNHVLTKRTP